MRNLRAQHRLVAWIPILAVLLMSLAPALSHALGRASGAPWVEVCSAEGSRWVQAEPGDAGEALGTAAHALQHCPYCSGHLSPLGLPPAPRLAVGDLNLQDEVPHALPAAPCRLYAWVRAQSRAPPPLV